MGEEIKKVVPKKLNFSKDNQIIEAAIKQSQALVKNVVPPAKPKESKKE